MTWSKLNKKLKEQGISAPYGDRCFPMSEQELSDLEQELGARMPELFRTFLLHYGGSSIDADVVKFEPIETLDTGNPGPGWLGAFYGGGDANGGCHLATMVHYYKGRMPEALIPICSEGGGSQICIGIMEDELGVKQDVVGKVWYWSFFDEPLDEADYLEDYGEPRPVEAWWWNVRLIANSFEELFDRLTVENLDVNR